MELFPETIYAAHYQQCTLTSSGRWQYVVWQTDTNVSVVPATAAFPLNINTSLPNHKNPHFKRQVTSTVTPLRTSKATNQQCNRQYLTVKTSTWHWNKIKLIYNLLKVLGVGFCHFTWNLSVRDSWNGVIARSEPRNLMSGLSAALSGSSVTCIDTLFPTGEIKYQKNRDRKDNLVC